MIDNMNMHFRCNNVCHKLSASDSIKVNIASAATISGLSLLPHQICREAIRAGSGLAPGGALGTGYRTGASQRPEIREWEEFLSRRGAMAGCRL